MRDFIVCACVVAIFAAIACGMTYAILEAIKAFASAAVFVATAVM